ncbi:MAG: radical SAM protein [Candidatus Krumholzibacteriota bacterium]|nr:radical SAM protein [Candidatus Krumholzibacteriota bacterium]
MDHQGNVRTKQNSLLWFLERISYFPNFTILVFAHILKYRIIPKPYFLDLEITNKCNFNCKDCSSHFMEKKGEELSTEEIFAVIEDAWKLGARHLNFSGGEPFMRPDLFEIARRARDIGFMLTVNTNGSLIEEKSIKLISTLFDGVILSIDTLDPELHSRIRPGPLNVQGFIRKCEQLRKAGIRVRISTVLRRENINDLDHVLTYFHSIGIQVDLQPLNYCDDRGTSVGRGPLPGFDKNHIFKDWETIRKKHLPNTEYYRYIPEFLTEPASAAKRFICFWGSWDLSVRSNGDVTCPAGRCHAGNTRMTPLIDIWKEMRDFRNNITHSGRPCVCWFQCTSSRYIPMTNLMLGKFNNLFVKAPL